MIVFKYTTLTNYIIDSIVDKYIFFTRMNILNDPHEATFGFAQESLTRALETIDPIAHAYIEDYKAYMKNSTFVFCVSTNDNNPAMWAYYANDHKGVCLEYDLPDDVNQITNDQQITNLIVRGHDNAFFHKVDYSDDDVEFPFVPQEPHSEFLNRYHQAVIRKVKDWDHEKEVRAIIRTEGCYDNGIKVKLTGTCLKSIIFGCALDEASILKQIRELMQALNVRFPERLPFTLKRAIKNPGEAKTRYIEL